MFSIYDVDFAVHLLLLTLGRYMMMMMVVMMIIIQTLEPLREHRGRPAAIPRTTCAWRTTQHRWAGRHERSVPGIRPPSCWGMSMMRLSANLLSYP